MFLPSFSADEVIIWCQELFQVCTHCQLLLNQNIFYISQSSSFMMICWTKLSFQAECTTNSVILLRSSNSFLLINKTQDIHLTASFRTTWVSRHQKG